MKRVALLTTFMDLPSGYGLVPVVLDQLQMLVDNGYEPHLLIQTQYNQQDFMERLPDGAVLKPVVPFIHLYEYEPTTEKQRHDVDAVGVYGKPSKTNFDKQVAYLIEGLSPALKDYDVILAHDIIFQTHFVVHNVAVREIAKQRPRIKWVHWFHSGPSPRPPKMRYPGSLRFRGMANSIYVSPNQSMIPKFAEMYNVPQRQIHHVYHAFDLYRFYGMHPFSIQLIEKHDLLDCDVLCVWATRMDSPVGKGYKYAVWLIAQMNKLCNAKLVFLNSSTDERARRNIADLFTEAEEWSLPQENLIFSSGEGGIWEQGVPQKVVCDLTWIANLFIFPSITETFGMNMIEAAACKNLLYLNEDLTVLKEIAGDNAIYGGYGSDWGGDTLTRHYDEDPYGIFMNDAKRILKELDGCKPLKMHRRVLQKFSKRTVWKEQLQPLIEGDW